MAQSFAAQFAVDPQHTGRVNARGPHRAPTIRWRFRVKRRVYANPIATEDRTVLFAGVDGMVHAVSATGVELWARYLDGSVFATPAHGFGVTVFGHGNAYTALDSRGNIRWNRVTVETADAPPLLVGSTAFIAVRGVSAVDVRDGAVRWDTNGPRMLAAPSLTHAATSLVVGDVEGNVRWLDATTGRELRMFETHSQIDSSPLVLEDDSVVVGSEDGHVRKLSSTGTLVWNTALGGEIHSTPALGRDGSVLVTSDDYRLYAVDPATGTQRWSVRTGNVVRSSPMVDRDGWIFFGSEDDNVYAVDPSGHIAWTLMLGADIDSSPLLLSDGEMYIGCDDAALYSLRE
jgi:outer membrane protein assembly factor BamB